ncbi:MAG: hypothetical protein CMM15_05090 [Rhodospirillaceae bacterium]|nr:hypothetical protein [Rhodospirillaceae bacterium]
MVTVTFDKGLCKVGMQEHGIPDPIAIHALGFGTRIQKKSLVTAHTCLEIAVTTINRLTKLFGKSVTANTAIHPS